MPIKIAVTVREKSGKTLSPMPDTPLVLFDKEMFIKGTVFTNSSGVGQFKVPKKGVYYVLAMRKSGKDYQVIVADVRPKRKEFPIDFPRIDRSNKRADESILGKIVATVKVGTTDAKVIGEPVNLYAAGAPTPFAQELTDTESTATFENLVGTYDVEAIAGAAGSCRVREHNIVVPPGQNEQPKTITIDGSCV